MKVGIVYNVSLVLDACLLVWTTTGILTGVCMIVTHGLLTGWPLQKIASETASRSSRR